MATKADKKNAIRQEIIDAAGVYSRDLAGRNFLYVYGEKYFEVSFPSDHFLHLTGVETILSAKNFYKNAKKSTLANGQFYFTSRHTYANAKKKLPCLKRLPELTNGLVCILKDMQTVSIIYKLSVTNLEFTLGLIENTDNAGEMKSKHRNIGYRQHQRAMFKAALCPNVLLWERVTTVSFIVANVIMKNIFPVVYHKLTADFMGHAVNTVPALREWYECKISYRVNVHLRKRHDTI